MGRPVTPQASMRRTSCLAGLSVVLGGCSITVPMRYQPSSAARPLDLEAKPRIYLDRVEDRTGGGQVAGRAGSTWVPPVPESLREALEVEFTRLGIPLVASRAKSDAVLSAAVTMASTRGSPGGLVADLALLLTMEGPKGEHLWENTLLGSGSSRGFTASPWGPAFTAALADMMSKLGPAFQSQDVLSKIMAGSSLRVDETSARKPRTAPPPIVRSDIDEPPRAGTAKRSNAYAVVIGIRQYRQDLPQADFADSDARLMRSYLTETLGFEESNVAILINEEATKSDLEKYLESWLPNRVEKEADVVVYYSGHGAPNPASGEAFLVPYDGDPTYLAKTGYPLARLYAEMGKLPARSVTIVMDSCFSGAGGRSVLAKGAKPLVSAVRQDNIPKNLAVLSASAGDQVSHAYHDKGHGLFTYFLLKAFKDRPGKDAPKWNSVFEAAAPQVARIARREYNADQAPQWQGPRP